MAAWLIIFYRPGNPQKPTTGSETNVVSKTVPSEILKEYQDPSGFKFSYPDNLSIANNEVEDESVYADVQLFASGINGSLNLKISDSKIKSINDWVKSVSSGEIAKEVKLGSLEARELKLTDRLVLGALDQGILFVIEVPLVEEEFWMKVYEGISTSFSFTVPSQESTVSGGAFSSDIIFEGEEVVE